MSSPFSNLSHDLILQIADLLWEEDVKYPWEPLTELISSGEQAVYNLSRTSTSLYELLSPYFFRSITFRNTKKSGRALQYLLSTSQVSNIKTLHFKCKISKEETEVSPSIGSIFPTEVNDVLSNLSQIPRLATLIIDLVLDDDRDDIYDTADDDPDLRIIGEGKSEEEVMTEGQKRYRVLVEKTLEAISTTCSDGVREFVFKQYPIRTNSFFREPFNKWLGKLESFRFEEYQGYIGARRALPTTTQFETYISNPENSFFDAIGNVTRLVIIGHEMSILSYIDREFPVPLKATHVPKLKEFELRYCSIQGDLLDFLVAHSSTLEHLVLNQCFIDFDVPLDSDVSPDPGYEYRGTFGSWFQSYAYEKPRALQCVTFIPYEGAFFPSCRSWNLDLSIKTSQVHGEQKGEGIDYRTFPYATIRKPGGELMLEHELGPDLNGEDLDAWYELAGVVRSNRERVRRD